MKKTTIITIVIIIVLIILGFYFFSGSSKTVVIENPTPTPVVTNTGVPQPSVTPVVAQDKTVSVIGKSVGGLDINAYHYGTGTKEILFVGGIHGGYEWNTVLVARQLMDYLKNNSSVIPAGVRVTVIPVLNPDGLKKVVGTSTGSFTALDVPTRESTVIAGRYNGDTVDLNRNFDCDWQSTGKWQSTTVSGGSAPFSEPESMAMKAYVTASSPAAVIVWYSAAGGVYASNCHGGVSDETAAIMKTYSKASGYSANDSFDFYATTGDMTNWLAKINVPAVSILLTNHTDTEWTKNLAGIKAVLGYYAK
jgi:uncharacterized protein YneF (UPF0154 family)